MSIQDNTEQRTICERYPQNYTFHTNTHDAIGSYY